jgi:hypothetical protein
MAKASDWARLDLNTRMDKGIEAARTVPSGTGPEPSEQLPGYASSFR